MSGLVGYGSSDEEDELQPERPAKISKTTHSAPVREETRHSSDQNPSVEGQTTQNQQAQVIVEESSLQEGPPPGPSISITGQSSTAATPSSAPASPYTLERQRLRELTMPTVPDFDIPDSPPPPPTNSEEAATLAATTRKFEKFLELKRNGIHFNQRLQNTSSLRNPSLLPKLLDFAGISTEESYASTLAGELGVPTRWPEECYVENLMKTNERREKKRLAERDKVEFVAASKSSASSATGTPKSASGGEGRRSKFDKK